MLRKDIIDLVEHYAVASADKLDHFSLVKNKLRFNDEFSDSFDNFINQLNDIAEFCRYNFDLKFASSKEMVEIIENLTFPIIAFYNNGKSLAPIIVKFKTGKKYQLLIKENGVFVEHNFITAKDIVTRLKTAKDLELDNSLEYSSVHGAGNYHLNDIVFLAGYSFSFGISDNDRTEGKKVLTPLQRFFSLLRAEKRDIGYIYFFAIMIALVSLTLPLGIQSIIGLISGGLLLESVIVLMLLVVLATFASGWLQVQQLSMVEVLQQRVFAKTALEFSFRIPRIKAEVLIKHYAPELVNRFFDVLNVQKSLPKILIDFTSAIVQIVFGLILLSFYHPLFIFFAMFVLTIMGIVFYFTGKRGLETSLQESKYKYKVAYWLEELGRSVNSFKLAGYTNLPVNKTDMLLDGYLKYRKKHFKVLVIQYISIVGFKTFVTAGLLVMGGLLVVNRQINLGQFVAAEIIIVLVITSVEKLITTISVIYDLLTALDKIGNVLDLPLEKNTGRDIVDLDIDKKFNLVLKNVSYTYPDCNSPAINNISLNITEGKKICIAGYNDAGKTTLLNVVSALYLNYAGSITVNNFSLKEISLNSYRSIIGDNLRIDDIFEGTIFDNITLGRSGVVLSHVIDACEKAFLLDFINRLSEGLSTMVQPKGANFPSNVVRKILLARTFIQSPKLLVIDEFFRDVQKREKQDLINNIFSNNWAVMVVSSQPVIMEKCDEVYIMQNGSFVASGSYNELDSKGVIKELFN